MSVAEGQSAAVLALQEALVYFLLWRHVRWRCAEVDVSFTFKLEPRCQLFSVSDETVTHSDKGRIGNILGAGTELRRCKIDVLINIGLYDVACLDCLEENKRYN